MATRTDRAILLFQADLRRATRGLGLPAPPARGLGLPVAPARAAARAQAGRWPAGARDRPLLRLALVEKNGILRWVEGGAGRPRAARRAGKARTGKAAGAPGEVHAFEFERLDPSEITAHLEKLDRRLTPARGLRRWKNGMLEPVARPSAGRGDRVLLLVPGTFCRSESILDSLAQASGGPDFLDALPRTYAQVLTFDHPTLSVGPMLNAFDLERSLAGCEATFDVVAHSRGGLVARAWAEAFRGGERGVGRLVFVGSTLAGTSLASPPRLRRVTDYLANLGRALGGLFSAAPANPFLVVGADLMQVVSSIASLASNTPLLDAVIAMVPGLDAQSRVGNNAFIRRLRDANSIPLDRVFAVRADFEPRGPGWTFWELFAHPAEHVLDLGVDMVFSGANDLVVECASTVDLAKRVCVPKRQVFDFGTQGRVHHCNYFAQAETVRFLRGALRVRG